MKFTAAIVAAIAATSAVNDVTAFGVHSRLAVRTTGPSTLRMSLNDLESKLLSDKPVEPATKSQPSRKTKQAPSPAPAPAPAPVAVVEVTPAKKGKKKERYVDLGDVATPAVPKAKVEAPKPAPAPKPVSAPPTLPARTQGRPSRTKVATPPSKSVVIKGETVKDPKAGPLGVALGAAPLLVAPLVALTAARGALGKTSARREQIQEEIAAKERAAKAKAKAKTTASVDSGGVVGALVSRTLRVT